MGIYDNWTYTDLHQLNLDWLLKEVKKIQIFNDNVDSYIMDTIINMIDNGQLTLQLHEEYDADTKSLTLTIIGE